MLSLFDTTTLQYRKFMNIIGFYYECVELAVYIFHFLLTLVMIDHFFGRFVSAFILLYPTLTDAVTRICKAQTTSWENSSL